MRMPAHLGKLAVVLLGAAAFLLNQKANSVDVVLAEWATHTIPATRNAEDVAGDLRNTLLAAGAVPLEDGVQVTVPESMPENAPPVVVTFQARYRLPILGLPLERSFSGSTKGQDLVASAYKGDGRPRPDGAGSQKLKKTLASARCPEGTSPKGDVPPKGLETWCERPDAAGKLVRHGPYFSWQPGGAPLEEGQFRDGKRDGRWTRFNAQGVREAEATYAAGVQHGRFRQWDASGAVVMDMEYRNGLPVAR